MSSRLDIITGRLSKLMLKRWSMLAENCPQDGCSTPLMRDPLSGETKCVWHDARELFPNDLTEDEFQSAPSAKDDEKLDEKIEADAESIKEDKHSMDDEKRSALQQKRAQGDEASQRIAKRLLQGWKMIDRVCPSESCYNVPLVQDRDEMQLCVICEQRYMDEEAYTKKYGPRKPEAEAPTNTEHAAEPAAEPKPAPERKKKEPRERASSAVAKPCVPQKHTSGAAAIDVAVEALQSKIADLSPLLEQATQYKDIVRISNAIRACAKAIRECQKL
ncbi:hypothetical protein GQ54DRAFT_312691 [Martensiomyces pterosporus]|nr:hypothetical protein GQ54DRAFT_312691 [Martensiomyces pterosporus]